MFYVGQRVAYIGKEYGKAGFGWETLPKKGPVYTIRAVTVRGSEEGLLLNEIVNCPAMYGDGIYEAAFPSELFRPVVERKTSIEVFTAMLNPSDKRVEA